MTDTRCPTCKHDHPPHPHDDKPSPHYCLGYWWAMHCNMKHRIKRLEEELKRTKQLLQGSNDEQD